MKNKIKSLILCLILIVEGGVFVKDGYETKVEEKSIPVIIEKKKNNYIGSQLFEDISKKGGTIISLDKKDDVWKIKIKLEGNKEKVEKFIETIDNFMIDSYNLIYENNTYNIYLYLSTT